jgi:hypothetical protein
MGGGLYTFRYQNQWMYARLNGAGKLVNGLWEMAHSHAYYRAA